MDSLNRSDSGLSGICIHYLYGILAGKTIYFDGFNAVPIRLIKSVIAKYPLGPSRSIQPISTRKFFVVPG
jgi:hypothetical protein